MILMLARSGQMCNQLMTLIAAYSLGLRYKDDVCCPIVDKDLKRHFVFQDQSSPIKVSISDCKVLYWIIYIFNRVVSVLRLRNLLFHNSYNLGKRGKVQFFFDAFWHKEDSAIIENLEGCQKFFAFKPEIVARCKNMMEELKISGRRCVAVHARRGDYKQFLGGKFYMTDEELAYWMKGFEDAENTRFVFFSNEKIDLEYYKQHSLDVVQSKGNAVEDLCCMSMCDCVMGPDSTYSWWAMVMGHIPRLLLEKGHGPYRWDDFKLYENAPYLRG